MMQQHGRKEVNVELKHFALTSAIKRLLSRYIESKGSFCLTGFNILLTKIDAGR